MESISHKIKDYIFYNNHEGITELLNNGLDPNFEGGWPVRFAARYGFYSIVKIFIQYGANPHLLGESGASTLQLAVYSGKNWENDNWTFLLSCCDSSQLADGAAVAIIFHNIAALKTIVETGRCNTNIPTTLTGRTVENLAKGYKIHSLLNLSTNQIQQRNITPNSSPRQLRQDRSCIASLGTPQQTHRNLSPSVAHFFNQTASQTSLTPPRNTLILVSPTAERLFT